MLGPLPVLIVSAALLSACSLAGDRTEGALTPRNVTTAPEPGRVTPEVGDATVTGETVDEPD